MQVFHTAGVPPSSGRIILPIIGWTRNSSEALTNSVSGRTAAARELLASVRPGSKQASVAKFNGSALTDTPGALGDLTDRRGRKRPERREGLIANVGRTSKVMTVESTARRDGRKGGTGSGATARHAAEHCFQIAIFQLADLTLQDGKAARRRHCKV